MMSSSSNVSLSRKGKEIPTCQAPGEVAVSDQAPVIVSPTGSSQKPVSSSQLGPATPVAPVAPVEPTPAAPVGPFPPVGPFAPVAPLAPFVPLLPSLPGAPAGPAGPVAPFGPFLATFLAMAFTSFFSLPERTS